MTGPARSGPAGGPGGSPGEGCSRASSSGATRYERSVRWWLNAYPRRWRVTYGDDLVATALELAVPGRRRFGVREGLALARAGWALRRRERPPWRVRVRVVLLGAPGVEDRVVHRAWLVDRALSPWLRLPGHLAFFGSIALLNVHAGLRGGSFVFHVVAAAVTLLAVVGPCVVPTWGRRASRAAWRALFPDEPPPPTIAPSPRPAPAHRPRDRGFGAR